MSLPKMKAASPRVALKRLVRLRVGAVVHVDHNVWNWPDLPHGDAEIIFRVTDSFHASWSVLCANFFGLHKPEGEYGNGSIYAKDEDLIPVSEPNTAVSQSATSADTRKSSQPIGG